MPTNFSRYVPMISSFFESNIHQEKKLEKKLNGNIYGNMFQRHPGID